MEVAAGTRSASGRALEKATSFSFKLPPPKVEQFHPASHRPVELEPVLFARFDQKIDRAAVLGHIELKPGARAVAQSGRGAAVANGTIGLRLATDDEIEADKDVRRLVQHAEPGRFVAFRAAAPLPKATPFAVTFKRGLPSAEGPKPSQQEQAFNISTYGPMRLTRIDCGWYEGCPPLAAWRAQFTNPIDTGTFDKSLVRVEPELSGMKVSVAGSVITLQGRSKGRTRYKVTVGQALKDTFGQTLEPPGEGQVEVDAAEPMLFPEERDMVVLDPAFEPALSVWSVNRNELRVRLYAVEPKDWHRYVKFRQDWDYEGRLTQPPGKLVLTRSVQPKKAVDELVETRIDLGPALKGGFGQLIAIVEPPQQKPRKNRWEERAREWVRSYIQVTKLGLQAFSDPTHVHGWVSRLSDGAPVRDAGVEILPGPGTGFKALAGLVVVGKTGPDGIAHVPAASSGSIVLARSGSDIVFLPGGDDHAFAARARSDHLRWFVFDDRNLYKPGERVSVKGWLRVLTAGKKGDVTRISAGQNQVSFTANDARGSKIAEGSAAVDQDGGFHLSFGLPKNANLGQGNLLLKLKGPAARLPGDEYGHQYQIEEFRRPEFEVSAETTEGPHFVGKHAIATVTASYYAGGALPDSDVKWRVQADDAFYAPPNRSGFHFGKPRRFSWWASPSEKDKDKRKADETWEARTQAGGQHRLRIDFDALEPAYPRKLDLEASVTDVNRQSWTARASLVVHPASVNVGLRPESTLPTAGQNLQVDVLTTDIEGKAVAGRSVTLTAARIESTWRGDELEQKARDPQTCTLKSDGSDTAQRCAFPTKEGGLHRLSADVTDQHGRKSHTELDIWVLGGDYPVQAGVRRGLVDVVPDRTEYASGEPAKLLVMAPFAPAEGVLTLEREGVVELQRFRLERRTDTISVRLDRSWVPGVRASVHLVGAAVRENDAGDPDPSQPKRPAFAHGSAELLIPARERGLKITVTPQPKALDPGATTRISLDVADVAGRPVPNSTLALVVVDEAVLALAGYQLPDPLAIFYASRDPDVREFVTHDHVVLGKPDLSRMQLQPKKTKNGGEGNVGTIGHGSGGGVGAGYGRAVAGRAAPAPKLRAAMANVSVDQEAELRREAPKSGTEKGEADRDGDGILDQVDRQPFKVRSDFSALAAFVPRLVTDARGRAEAKVKLPDNLTRYRVVAVAGAGDNQFGSAESDVTARLPLMVRPSPPRFLNFGDRAELPVVVQNQTAEPITVDVALRVANVKLIDPNGQRVVVPAADRVELRFPIGGEPGGDRALPDRNSRSLEDGLVLRRRRARAAGVDAGDHRGVRDLRRDRQGRDRPAGDDAGGGGHGVRRARGHDRVDAAPGADRRAALPRALPVRVQRAALVARARRSRRCATCSRRSRPRDCRRPQRSSARSRSTCEKLGDRQHYSGGWDFWRRDREPDPYVSVHVTHALVRAKSKGYKVPEQQLTSALGFLRSIENHFPPYWPPKRGAWSRPTR